MKSLLVSLAVAAGITPAPAASATPPAIERAVDSFRSAYHPEALTLAATRGNQLVLARTYGFADAETGRRATNLTVFLTGSISKTVVAVAAMQLVEQGRLDLDADINRYLPFVVTNPKAPGSAITARELLTHTSGIRDGYFDTHSREFFLGADRRGALAPLCRDLLVPGGRDYRATNFAAGVPGRTYAYSNTAVTLLACLIESISGELFDAYTAKHIFGPLGMTRTSWRLADYQPRELALNYSPDGTAYPPFTLSIYPVGALRTTAIDLSKFLRAIVLRGAWRGRRILQPSSVEQMLSLTYPPNPTLSSVHFKQGLIWYGFRYPGQPALIGHSGAAAGVATIMAFDPRRRTGAILIMTKELETEAENRAFEGRLLGTIIRSAR